MTWFLLKLIGECRMFLNLKSDTVIYHPVWASHVLPHDGNRWVALRSYIHT